MHPATAGLLPDWLHRITRAHVAHLRCASHFERSHVWLGALVIALTAIVGTGVFATLEREAGTLPRVLAGAASVLASMLAALQTFLRHSDRAKEHGQAARRYGALKREVEQRLALAGSDLDETAEVAAFAESVRARWDALVEEAPMVPQPIWDRVKTQLDVRREQRLARIRPPVAIPDGAAALVAAPVAMARDGEAARG